MRSFFRVPLMLLMAGTLLFPVLSFGKAHSTRPSAKSSTSSGKHASAKKTKAHKGAWKRHGQQNIDNQRTRQIQQALIREHYLDGEVTGAWDQRTKNAMTRYQSDNGWQSKVTPDSRALIKLGLGPDFSNALNAENIAPKPPAANPDTKQAEPQGPQR